ncbi:hypothetical protein KVR01_007578 [Diaporthe batatas]|uniref:uncharacterized protein n=1 Tax=Diaporthe batatas TaxID=748121 RepID=UPI001D05427C|nr:uncharacterized protein KVR01_007578 [Diaporthe batatas]KAG8163100.1 hypothetical protein KVR01_007578 [Diaporthe batatas]
MISDVTGSNDLRELSFSRNVFLDLARKMCIHNSILRTVSRADMPAFFNAEVEMELGIGNETPGYVYNCRSSNTWPMDLALAATHFPSCNLTFAMVFGCSLSVERTIIKRLKGAILEASHPLLMPGIFVELERTRHLEIIEQSVGAIEKRITTLAYTSQQMEAMASSQRDKDNHEKRDQWLDTTYLRNSLTSWNEQLRTMEAHLNELIDGQFPHRNGVHPSTRARRKGKQAEVDTDRLRMERISIKIRNRVSEIIKEYDDKIRDCTMRVDGMAMATQWAQGETNVDIALATSKDSRHMRSIALVTMIFLPGTFFAHLYEVMCSNGVKKNKIPSPACQLSHNYQGPPTFWSDSRHACRSISPTQHVLRASPGPVMEQALPGRITLHVASIGDDPSHLEFRDTSFFKPANSTLPSPADVLQHYEKGPKNAYGIAIFRELGLVVKFGQPCDCHLDNALTMRALWQAFPDREIPVPEVFGWASENDKNFIYMSLVPGRTLYEAWPSLSPSEKESICKELGSMQGCLRRLTPESEEVFIGSITRGEVRDRFARDDRLNGRPGPFATIKDFNDWVKLAALPHLPASERDHEDPYREFLPDIGDVHFAHGDFHLGNIMVSNVPGEVAIITGIIDWEEAGWYPSYWEYCKMKLVIDEEHEVFTDGYIDSIFPRRCDNEMIAVGGYWSCRGYP